MMQVCKKCKNDLKGSRIIKEYENKVRVVCKKCGWENFYYPQLEPKEK